MSYLICGVIVVLLLAWAGRRPRGTREGLRAGRFALTAVWRKLTTPSPTRGGDLLSEAEARAILGLAADASASDVETAYRRLMLRVHPDRGGTAAMASQLNAARDRLARSRP